MTITREFTELLAVRTVVALIGERTDPPWWRTRFLTEVGLKTTARIYPRTAACAAIRSVTVAAQADHDRRIGVGGRYHLFRLPTSTELALAARAADDVFKSRLGELVKRRQEELLEELASLASDQAAPAIEGPVRIGLISVLPSSQTVALLATHYHASVLDGRRRFPYFEEADASQ